MILRHANECTIPYRGVEQLVARRAHNPEVAGSSPASATISSGCNGFQLHPLLFFAKSIDKDIVREYTLMI